MPTACTSSVANNLFSRLRAGLEGSIGQGDELKAEPESPRAAAGPGSPRGSYCRAIAGGVCRGEMAMEGGRISSPPESAAAGKELTPACATQGLGQAQATPA